MPLACHLNGMTLSRMLLYTHVLHGHKTELLGVICQPREDLQNALNDCYLTPDRQRVLYLPIILTSDTWIPLAWAINRMI